MPRLPPSLQALAPALPRPPAASPSPCAATRAWCLSTCRNRLTRSLPCGRAGTSASTLGDTTAPCRWLRPLRARLRQLPTVSTSIAYRLWTQVHGLQLRTNMRAMVLLQTLGEAAADRQRAWADYLLAVGEGRASEVGQLMRLPDDLIVPGEDILDLVRDVYGDLRHDPTARLPDALIHRCILTPKNVFMHQINEAIVDMMPGEEHVSHSADKADDSDEAAFPPEFLNSLNPQGLPSHRLRLKPGCPIILLRNLNFKAGLANGTRLIVNEIRRNVLLATILTGPHRGDRVFIPRIKLNAEETPLNPVAFSRTQFPVRLAFAMSINKAQGQTFQRVGIYLPQSCFSHGQLYVAMSRVGERSGVRIMVVNGTLPGEEGTFTANVVYHEIFGGTRRAVGTENPPPIPIQAPPPLTPNIHPATQNHFTLQPPPPQITPLPPRPLWVQPNQPPVHTPAHPTFPPNLQALTPNPVTPAPQPPRPSIVQNPPIDPEAAMIRRRNNVTFSHLLVPLFALALNHNTPYMQQLAALHFPPGSPLHNHLPQISSLLLHSPLYNSWLAVRSPLRPNYIEAQMQEDILDYIFLHSPHIGTLITSVALNQNL